MKKSDSTAAAAAAEVDKVKALNLEMAALLRQAVEGCGKGDEVWLGYAWVHAAQKLLEKAEG
jgi:hypothetical protein